MTLRRLALLATVLLVVGVALFAVRCVVTAPQASRPTTIEIQSEFLLIIDGSVTAGEDIELQERAVVTPVIDLIDARGQPLDTADMDFVDVTFLEVRSSGVGMRPITTRLSETSRKSGRIVGPEIRLEDPGRYEIFFGIQPRAKLSFGDVGHARTAPRPRETVVIIDKPMGHISIEVAPSD